DRQKQAIVDKGKHAVTHFTVLERFGNFTLVECRLETGRTHQIRVHMNYIGYPLAGDPKYGPKKTIDFGGQALHAGVLGFIQPVTKEYIEFESALPAEFEQLLTEMRAQATVKKAETE
ncbi:MAG: pseudouridine synthase, partial [Solibacillus sp.]